MRVWSGMPCLTSYKVVSWGRDLADWTVRMLEPGASGVYNVVSPPGARRMGELLDACRKVSGSEATFTWASADFLLAQGVDPFKFDLPLWLPKDYRNFVMVNSDRAQARGLSVRPLNETVRDTLEWRRIHPSDGDRRAGISRARERELLAAWRAR